MPVYCACKGALESTFLSGSRLYNAILRVETKSPPSGLNCKNWINRQGNPFVIYNRGISGLA